MRFPALNAHLQKLNAYHLPAIKQIPRIHRLLDRAHHRHRLAVFGVEEIQFAKADPVLTRAGAIHRVTAFHETIQKALGAFDFVRIVEIDEQVDVEIAVANMPDSTQSVRNSTNCWNFSAGLPLRLPIL